MNSCDVTLYGIVDPARTKDRPVDELARISAENGVTLIQYRDKQSDIRTMIKNASAIKSALEGINVPLIINDRVDVALASDADGVHLGQQDMPVDDARRILGSDAVIGISIKTIEEAQECPIDAIDYAFVGGVFETQSKNNPIAIGIDGWMERANIIKNMEPDIPVGAIAGIDEGNIVSLFEAGCDGVAIISALFMADDVSAATQNLSRLIKEARS